MATKQDLMFFAKMTPEEYQDELQQLRLFDSECKAGEHPDELLDPVWEQRRKASLVHAE
jgi:hypothetical protein